MKNKNICRFNSLSLSDTLSISCFVLETDPTVMEQPRALTAHLMLLVSGGEGCFRFGERAVPFRTGSLVFGFQGEVFSVERSGEVTYMYIQFEGNRAEELFRRFDVKSANRVFDSFDGLIPLWTESLCRASEQTADLASESMLLYTFSRLSNSTARRNSLVNRIVEITEEEFTDTELSLNAIAERLSYNPKYISYIFKEQMGVGYAEYLRALRIKFAVSLFDRGIDSVKNVAFLSGFSDPLYFSTVFKKALGISPKEYKNQNLS